MKAKRPEYSDIEHNVDHWQKLCSTCWQPVSEPYIKGLWFHDDSHIDDALNCQKLIPITYGKINRDAKYTCHHMLRINKDILGAMKCIKCGFPQRVDLLYQETDRKLYYCITCKTNFRILSQHSQKHHKDKRFEYNELG